MLNPAGYFNWTKYIDDIVSNSLKRRIGIHEVDQDSSRFCQEGSDDSKQIADVICSATLQAGLQFTIPWRGFPPIGLFPVLKRTNWLKNVWHCEI